MAGFSGVMTGLSLVSNLVGGLSSYSDNQRTQEATLRAMQQRQQADAAYQAQDAAYKRAEIQAEAKKAEDERIGKLKRAVARQRSLFGVSGISPSSSGSAEAVLLGLFDESEDQRQTRERLDQLKMNIINNNQDYRGRVNILELEEKRDKQNIGRISSLLETVNKTSSLLG